MVLQKQLLPIKVRKCFEVMKQTKEKIKIVIMTGNGLRYRYFANFLTSRFNILGIVSETINQPSNQSQEKIRKHFLERDQKENYYLKGNEKFNTEKVLFVSSGQSNSHQVFNWVTNLKLDFLVLYGASIIKDPLLSHFKNRIINMHLGLSPYYRGTGTNFWPLVNREPECLGTTIHLATSKVDAGPILLQARPSPEISDRCHDLGCKAIMVGAELMAKALKEYYANKIIPKNQSGQGKLYKSNDFNVQAVSKMWANFDTGMMREYLKNKSLKDKKYPILCVS